MPLTIAQQETAKQLRPIPSRQSVRVFGLVGFANQTKQPTKPTDQTNQRTKFQTKSTKQTKLTNQPTKTKLTNQPNKPHKQINQPNKSTKQNQTNQPTKPTKQVNQTKPKQVFQTKQILTVNKPNQTKRQTQGPLLRQQKRSTETKHRSRLLVLEALHPRTRSCTLARSRRQEHADFSKSFQEGDGWMGEFFFFFFFSVLYKNKMDGWMDGRSWFCLRWF